MAKDPAFLFYPGDYLRDTQSMSEKSQVAYDRIMCEHMRNICITQKQLDFFTKKLNVDEKDEILMVLTKTETGNFEIHWVADSITKRKSYSESRRNNRLGTEEKETKKEKNISKSYDKHMENENEIEDKDVIKKENKSIEDRKIEFAKNVQALQSLNPLYTNQMLMAFCQYWCEHNPDGFKMRFEMQKVFDISLRLTTWKKNENKFKKNGTKLSDYTPEELSSAIADEVRKRTQ